jgi:ankyrin repeat protein
MPSSVATKYRKRQHKHEELTKGLEYITYWFEKGGRGSVLEWAIFRKQTDTYKRLVELPGMNLSQDDCWGTTLLHRLAGQGSVQYMEVLITQLRVAGLDPFHPDGSLLTPLHYAAGRGMLEAVKLLLSMGAKASAMDYNRNTPLHLAAVTGSDHVFDILVEAGADINSECRFGWIAVDLADISQRHYTVEKLMRLGSRPPTWQNRVHAMDEFVRISPCPVECFGLHVTFGNSNS